MSEPSAKTPPEIFFQIAKQSIENVHFLIEAYHLDKSYRCRWHSISKVSIDPLSSSLNYIYEVDKITDEAITIGLFKSYFYSNKKFLLKSPCRINGYAFNLLSKSKLRTLQIKISDSTVINLNNDYINELLQKATDLYECECHTWLDDPNDTIAL